MSCYFIGAMQYIIKRLKSDSSLETVTSFRTSLQLVSPDKNRVENGRTRTVLHTCQGPKGQSMCCAYRTGLINRSFTNHSNSQKISSVLTLKRNFLAGFESQEDFRVRGALSTAISHSGKEEGII